MEDTMAETHAFGFVYGGDRTPSSRRTGPSFRPRHAIRFAYTQLLTDCGITISMSRKRSPWDNAACESFMKTLKHGEVHRTEYRNLAEARTRIGVFLRLVYDDRRLYSSLKLPLAI